MSSDAYRRVGRGGAGNYISKETADKAEAALPDNADLEKLATNVSTAAGIPPAKDQYARAGRGGAGNFVDPASLPDARQQEETADRTKAAVNASIARSGKGYSGRGGAGNWTTVVPGEEDTAGIEGQEELERRVVEDVERGLARPDKAHTATANGNSNDDAE